MHNPTQNDTSFYIEAIAGKKVYHLKSLNKEDHYEWGDIIHEVSVCLFVSSYICLFVCLFIYLFLYLFVFQNVLVKPFTSIWEIKTTFYRVNYNNKLSQRLTTYTRCGCYAAPDGMWLRYDCNDLVARVCCVCVCVLERSVTDCRVVVWLVV